MDNCIAKRIYTRAANQTPIYHGWYKWSHVQTMMFFRGNPLIQSAQLLEDTENDLNPNAINELQIIQLLSI